MTEPMHLRDAINHWWQGAPEAMNIHADELVLLHSAICNGRADQMDLEAAQRIVEGELQRFAGLLDRLNERQAKGLRRNQRTMLQKVRSILGYTYP